VQSVLHDTVLVPPVYGKTCQKMLFYMLS